MIKQSGFSKKLFVVYTAVFLISILILISGFGIYILDTHKSQQDKVFLQLCDSVVEKVEGIIEDMQEISSQIVGNVSIQREMINAVYNIEDTTEYFESHIEARRRVRMECSAINISENSVDQIFIYRSPDIFLRYAGYGSESDDVYDILQSEENKELIQYGEGEYYKILSPHKSRWEQGKSELVISLIRPLITTYSTKEEIATVEVTKSYKELVKTCILNEEEIQPNVIIMDTKNQEIIYPYGEVSKDEQQFYGEQIKESGKLRTIKNLQNQKEIVYVENLKDCNWSVVFHKPYAQHLKSTNETLVFIVLLTLLFVFFTVVIIYLLIQRLTKPIRMMRKSLDEITFENMKIIPPEEMNDEVELLRVRFNELLENLRISSNLLVQSKTAELQGKLNSLQSQINPHFLYNSIMVIGAAAQEENNQKVEMMCLELSNLFRYASEEASQCTLQQEIEYIERYLHFMKWRYLEDLEYEIRTVGTIRKVLIPKMILQPIIENCFAHGFYTIRPPYKIEIEQCYTEDKWSISIKDNGGGFSEEILKEINGIKNEIDNNYLNGKVGEITNNNKAIMNVYARMKLLYKEDLIFKIGNQKEGGAYVVLGATDSRDVKEC